MSPVNSDFWREKWKEKIKWHGSGQNFVVYVKVALFLNKLFHYDETVEGEKMYLKSKIWNIVDERMLKEFKKRQMCSYEITNTVVPGQVKLVLGDMFASFYQLANKQEVHCSQNGKTEMIWHVYSNTYSAIFLFF